MQRPSRGLANRNVPLESDILTTTPPPSSSSSIHSKVSTPIVASTRHARSYHRLWWYMTLIGVGCYSQIVVNFMVFQWGQNNHNRLETQLREQTPRISSSVFSFFDQQHHHDQVTEEDYVTGTRYLVDKLSVLRQRADRMLSEAAAAAATDGEPAEYMDDGRFLPFTIRDARRTVATQIPHGFHVFDFINVHHLATYTKPTERTLLSTDDETPNLTNSSFLTENLSNGSDDPQDDDDEDDSLTGPLPLFHNGNPVTFPYNVTTVLNATQDCQSYSMACYRSNLLQVLRYLLHAPQFRDYTYFFYMESDYDLCTSLMELRSMTYQYQRYFVSVGTRSSGWIMSRNFVQDFFDFYSIHYNSTDGLESTDQLVLSTVWGMNEVSNEEMIRPDLMAALMLHKQNKAWSVSRRYLTSHTILTSAAFGVSDLSLMEHFEYDEQEDLASNSTTSTESDVATVVVLKKKNNSEAADGPVKQSNPAVKKIEMLPPMVPKIHLPRCLEPHRGILPENNNKLHDGGGDDNPNQRGDPLAIPDPWDYYDYEQCPNSPIFPCDEDVDRSRSMQQSQKLRGSMIREESQAK